MSDELLHSLAGVAGLLVLAWLLSEDRRAIPKRLVLSGLALCFALAALMLRLPGAAEALGSFNAMLQILERATAAGTSLVFGYLGGGAAPFEARYPENVFILGFRALPLVLVVSALSALLFHWGILPSVVRAFAWVLRRVMGLGGAVGLSAAANVFVGMVEAPLVIRPWLARLSRGELFIVMVCGMATIAGTVLVLYATLLAPVLPGALAHLLVASVVATPAAIVIAALMVPPGPAGLGAMERVARTARSSMDALTHGVLDGLQLLLQIVAMLIVFVALVSLVNAGLALAPAVAGAPLSLERVLGWAMAPLAWLCGIPWSEAATAGALLGKKTVLNELVAYLDLARLPPEALAPRSRLLMTYALCGFANFGSLGILLGGMGAMVPERRGELAELGMKSIVAGTLATCLAAAVAGAFV
ncbi:MAG: nucleoside:proton symporter [Betaproteobacteria bacterium]|nr:nucleoside:proton symporter [Betaproteobacteria bacterium]